MAWRIAAARIDGKRHLPLSIIGQACENQSERYIDMARQVDMDILVPPPITREEQREAFAAIKRVSRHRAELLAARGGRLFSPSGQLLDDLQEERTRELP
jgi:hypothetical protein